MPHCYSDYFMANVRVIACPDSYLLGYEWCEIGRTCTLRITNMCKSNFLDVDVYRYRKAEKV
jgi:hypothetical protein